MKTEEKSEKINRILGIISAVIGIVGSIFGIFQAQQAATLKNEVNSLQTASQQTIVNVVSTLGDDAKTSELTETGDMVAATDQLISVLSFIESPAIEMVIKKRYLLNWADTASVYPVTDHIAHKVYILGRSILHEAHP